MFDVNLIKITIVNVTLAPGVSFQRKVAAGGTEDVGLSHAAMADVYGDESLYSQVDFRGYGLPYTLEATFFDDGSPYVVHPGEMKCVYAPSEDLHLIPKTHPLFDSSLRTALQAAYTKRRWDNVGRWGEPSAVVSSRTLLRIVGVDRPGRTIQFSKTDYDTQAVTNLVPDMPVNGRTLRKITFEKGSLPSLGDRRLANNLGVSILFVDSEGVPFLPLRADEGVAVFPGEWGCTLSFAADFPASVSPNSRLLFQEMISTAVSNQVMNELKAVLGHLTIVPLALTREWFRVGKAQLFMVCESPYSRDEIGRRLKSALHSEEVATRRWVWLLQKNKVLWDGKASDRNFSIEALCNWALYVHWKGCQKGRAMRAT